MEDEGRTQGLPFPAFRFGSQLLIRLQCAVNYTIPHLLRPGAWSFTFSPNTVTSDVCLSASPWTAAVMLWPC